MTTWTTGTVASGGEDITYEVVGDDPAKPWVVLTHGAGGSHAVWFQQVPALAQRYRVVTWDCRGFGTSTYRSGRFTLDDCVADLLAVMDAAGADRAHLVGQSMGGWWVAAATVRAPHRARSLTLCDTIGGLYTAELDAAMAALTAAPPPTGLALLGGHPAVHPSLVARDPALAFLYQELGTFSAPPMRDAVVAMLAGRSAHADLAATGVPVLVLAGSEDPLFPAALLQASAGRLGAAFTEIAGGGHSPYFEQAAAWNAAVIAFLDAH